MNNKLNNFLKYGIHQDLAIELISKDLNITTIKNTSAKNLVNKYGLDNSLAIEIKNLVKRTPIEDSILNKLLLNNNFTCCCCIGNKGQTIIVHHIIEYSQTQDNSYDNLAVLCPTCHDLVHSSRALTLSITIDQLREAKNSWETNCINARNNNSHIEIIEPLVESWIEQFEIIDEDFTSEYFFDLGLYKTQNEIYGHFTITYLNRGNMFMAGEFRHENNEDVDIDINITYWGMNWGRRITEKNEFKAIISYGFENEIHITNLDSQNDIIPYQLHLKKEKYE